MARTALFFCAAVLLAAGVGMFAPAQAEPANASQYCHANGDWGLSHGTCVACYNQGRNFATCICKEMRDTEGYEAFGFRNHGDCVSYFKSVR